LHASTGKPLRAPSYFLDVLKKGIDTSDGSDGRA
jgi:hypothetical protein